MNTAGLKIKILERIIEIDDVELLKSIEYLLNTSDKNVLKFLNVAFEQKQQETQTKQKILRPILKNGLKICNYG